MLLFRRIKLSLFALIISLLSVNTAYSATYWVGDSGLCSGSNVYSSLNLALIAAFISSENDEIRLTDTVNYTGNTNGTATLTDFHPGVHGSITIVGGYPDCFTSNNGSRTLMGNTSNNVINVDTDSQSSSIVTLKNLNLVGGAFRGINASGNVEITLDNVRIADNPSGMFVHGGAYVNLMANSIIENNTLNGNTNNGGGIECTDTNSQVDIHGQLKKNMAQKGGNLYLRSGCYVELYGGAIIEGRGRFVGGVEAIDGGAIYVADGGVLFSNGGASRVTIFNNVAWYGSGLYIVDTGRATLLNTVFHNNEGTTGNGSVIYAANGGNATAQVIMDRVGPCPFGYSCSEIEGSIYSDSVVFASNSLLEFNRTIMELSDKTGSLEFAYYIISATNNAVIRLNRVGIARNESNYLIGASSGGRVDVAQSTFAENYFEFEGNSVEPWVTLNVGEVYIQNSIFANTRGTDRRGGQSWGRCNLVDDPGDMFNGTYHIGDAIFNNAAGGDIRQMSSSPGVDMCDPVDFSWTSNHKDIEFQDAPVNDFDNPQGMPGDDGGMYDAGYDENHTNIGEDMFILNVLQTGTGTGTVISTNPLGIACGSDCMEVLFNGTLVEMTAIPDAGSVIASWSGCDISSGPACALTMNGQRTVTATFAPDDLIFANDFE